MRNTVVLSLIAAAALFLACADDENPVIPDGNQHSFQNLTQREHVLNNLEKAYSTRTYPPYDDLLDPNFTFFFSPGDVGGNIPDQWGRDQELGVAIKLFDPTLNEPPYPTCRSIRMDLRLEDGVQWVEVIPEDFPTETWYTTTVEYDFTFEMNPDQMYNAADSSLAQFTVRNVGTDSAPKWRLVEWRDLGSNSRALLSAASTEATTWGGIKALYR